MSREKRKKKYDQNFTASYPLTVAHCTLLIGSHLLLAYTCSCLWTLSSFQEKEVCLVYFFLDVNLLSSKILSSSYRLILKTCLFISECLHLLGIQFLFVLFWSFFIETGRNNRQHMVVLELLFRAIPSFNQHHSYPRRHEQLEQNAYSTLHTTGVQRSRTF